MTERIKRAASRLGAQGVRRALSRAMLPLALLLTLLAGVVLAADGPGHASGGRPSEAVFIVQIVLLLVFGRLLGEAMQRIGHPAVMGQILAGILLGPSVFGAISPELQQALFPETPNQKSMIDAVSQLGVLMLLLLTGMETDLSVVNKARGAALSVSVAGIAVPFACGVALGEMLPASMLPDPEQRLITSLFLGTALSISSVKIVAMVIREMNFMRRNIGQIILAAAITDDTIGWIVIAVIFSLASGGLDWASLAKSVVGTTLFLAASFTIGRRLVFLLIRWTNDTFVSEMPVITAILVVMGVMALITHAIGVHTVLGAFVAGILVGQSPILTRHIDQQLRGLIVALFMPVFFGLAGLHANLAVLADPSLLLLTGALIGIASIGKFSGALIGGTVGGLSWRESLAVGAGMNARGSTEVIVATIGLGMGALSQDLFTMIVTMAFVTTMAMPPTLRWALGRLPVGADEKARLEKEASETRAFVPNIERLLVAVDETASGKFASRLVGLLASARRMPITAMRIATGKVHPEHPLPDDDKIDSIVRATAEAAGTASSKPEAAQGGSASMPVDITVREGAEPVETAVTREAAKGYGLLVVGIEPTLTSTGEIDEKIRRICADFEGPFALTVARGTHRTQATVPELDILVPVTGTPTSRRGAELALALAGAVGGSITALHVATPDSMRPLRHGLRAQLRGRNHENAILADIVSLGASMGVPVRPVIRRIGASPGNAILRQARAGRHTLVVMGVSVRPGSSLFFGNVPALILDQCETSILFLSS